MDKKILIELIRSHLEEELAEMTQAASKMKQSAAAVSDPALQSAVLAAEARIGEVEKQLLMYRFLPTRAFGSEDVVCPGALVELELLVENKRALYFLTPQGGGLVMRFEGRPLQVITPQSPIGAVLLGKRVDDQIDVASRGSVRRYRVVSVD
jgi:transcription elongation GreA/GreB family factor